MGYFQKLSAKVAIFLCAICASASTAYALYEGPTQVGVDGSGNSVFAWQTFSSGKYVVWAAYGNDETTWASTAQALSDSSSFNVKAFPLAAVAKGTATGAVALVAWIATDSSNVRVLQASYLDTSGSWNAVPATGLTPASGSNPRDDFLVSISDDGQTLVIAWKVQSPSLQNKVSISTDGGANWTTLHLANVS